MLSIESMKRIWNQVPAELSEPYKKKIMEQAEIFEFRSKENRIIHPIQWNPVRGDKEFETLSLFNAKALARYFATMKYIIKTYYSQLPFEFGSENFKKLIIELNQTFYPWGSPKAEFWVSLRKPTASDDSVHVPIFTEEQNQSHDLCIKRQAYDAFFSKFSAIWIIYPDNPSLPSYRMIKSLGIAADQRVFLVQNIKNPADMKVAKFGIDPYEIGKWENVKELGIKPFLEFSTDYRLFTSRGDDPEIILMEKLSPIDESVNIGQFILDILPQLQGLHRAGYVYNDLKPENVMVRRKPDGTLVYLLIDMDVTDRPFNTTINYPSLPPLKVINPNAIWRRLYSALWTSQVQTDATATSYRYDLQELIYTLIGLLRIKLEYVLLQQDPDFDFLGQDVLGNYVNAPFASPDSLIKHLSFEEIISDLHNPFKAEYKSHGFAPVARVIGLLQNEIYEMPEFLPFNQINYIQKLSDIVLKSNVIQFADPVKTAEGSSEAWLAKVIG